MELVPAFEGTLPLQKKPDFSIARPLRPLRKRKKTAFEVAVVDSIGDKGEREGDS